MESFSLAWGFELLLHWLPTLALALCAAVLPYCFRRVTETILNKLNGRLPRWLHILVTSYQLPATMLLRIFFVIVLLYFLPVPFNGEKYRLIIQMLGKVAAVALFTWGGWNASPLCQLLLRSAENHLDMDTNRTMGRFFENIFRALVILLGGIMILDLLGVPVTGLLTGAGVAGLAISLAAQSTLSSLIAGITLVLEHPFGIGDYVVLSSYEGTVEDISFRSTRLRTPDNVVITVENSKICAEYIQNVTNRTSRLWEFTIGVTYDTPRDIIEKLSYDLAELLKADPAVDAERVIVYLSAFADSSINLTARLYVDTLALADFLMLKNRMNLQIMDLVQRDGCSFAFPSTSVYLESGEK